MVAALRMRRDALSAEGGWKRGGRGDSLLLKWQPLNPAALARKSAIAHILSKSAVAHRCRGDNEAFSAATVGGLTSKSARSLSDINQSIARNARYRRERA